VQFAVKTTTMNDVVSNSNAEANGIEEALRSLQRTLDELRKCKPEERENLKEVERQLEQLLSKLTHGRVEIVVIGEISTGKSALINALAGQKVASVDVRGGWTRDVNKCPWAEYKLPGQEQSSVVLVDTPGLNEIDGEARATLAKQAAETADLILFVTDSDLNEVEYQTLLSLHRYAKPIIVVLNKEDLLSRDQKERLLEVLRTERLTGIVPPDLVIPASADPRECQYIIQKADGTEECRWQKPAPNVVELKQRILEILDREGLSLVVLNSSMYASDASDKIVQTRMRYRQQTADRIILGYSVLKGMIVGAIPFPLADLSAGAVCDVVMIYHLARVYDIPISRSQAAQLLGVITAAAGGLGLSQWALQLGFNALKTLTLGFSTVLTFVSQAVVAAFTTYIVGLTAQYYFEHGASWGDEDPRRVIGRILNSIDRNSVMQQLKEQILAKCHRRRA
jgi:hypothetical protein